MSDRTPHTDALDTLGSIISKEESRDAIHLAVEPAIAGRRLKAGDHVGFLNDGSFGPCNDPVGIVDPFLTTTVSPGQRFWLVIYPRQITSLRHVWSHPAFDSQSIVEPPTMSTMVSRSIVWITEYAEELGFSYDEMIQGAKDYLAYGDSLCGGDDMEGNWTSDEFWDHFEVATGGEVDDDDRGNFFRCSC